MTKKMSDARREEILGYHERGMTTKWIASEMISTYKTVNDVIRAEGRAPNMIKKLVRDKVERAVRRDALVKIADAGGVIADYPGAVGKGWMRVNNWLMNHDPALLERLRSNRVMRELTKLRDHHARQLRDIQDKIMEEQKRCASR